MRKLLQNRLYFVICDVLFSLDNLLFESARLHKIKMKVDVRVVSPTRVLKSYYRLKKMLG